MVLTVTTGTLSSVLKIDFLLKFSVKILFCNCKHNFSPLKTFMRKGKDPDPYLWLRMRPKKHADPDPQHWFFAGNGRHFVNYVKTELRKCAKISLYLWPGGSGSRRPLGPSKPRLPRGPARGRPDPRWGGTWDWGGTERDSPSPHHQPPAPSHRPARMRIRPHLLLHPPPKKQ